MSVVLFFIMKTNVVMWTV